jgi:hypothetical protein
MCFQTEKTVQHLFIECTLAKEIKTYINDDVDILSDPSFNYKQGNLKIIIDPRENLQWRRLQTTTCFIIWQE